MIGQFAAEQQHSHLFKSEAMFLLSRVYQLCNVVTAIIEFSFGGMNVSLAVAFIAMHIAYVGQPHKHTRSVLVAQATFHAKARKLFSIEMDAVFHLVGQFVDNVLFLDAHGSCVCFWGFKCLCSQ